MDSFNPRTYIRYDGSHQSGDDVDLGFNPRTYIRYDVTGGCQSINPGCFNPRTYIRYDAYSKPNRRAAFVSIHVPI